MVPLVAGTQYTVGQICDGAADILDEFGWGKTTPVDFMKRRCVVSAINKFLGQPPLKRLPDAVLVAIHDELMETSDWYRAKLNKRFNRGNRRLTTGLIMRWNDHRSTRRGDVVGLLRRISATEQATTAILAAHVRSTATSNLNPTS